MKIIISLLMLVPHVCYGQTIERVPGSYEPPPDPVRAEKTVLYTDARCSFASDGTIKICIANTLQPVAIYIVEKIIYHGVKAVEGWLEQAENDAAGVPRKSVENTRTRTKCTMTYDRDANKTTVRKYRENGTVQWSADHDGDPARSDDRILASCSIDD